MLLHRREFRVEEWTDSRTVWWDPWGGGVSWRRPRKYPRTAPGYHSRTPWRW